VVYSLIVTGVLDEAGNEMSLLDNSATFTGNMVISDDSPAGSEFSEEFLDAFLNCEAGVAEELTTAFGSIEYEILGEKDELCEVKITYTDNPNPDFNGSGMTCLVDTLMDPEIAFAKSDEDGLCENFEADGVLASDDDDDTDVSGLSLTPENVQNFVAAVVSDLVVKLTWDKANDSSIIDQILYKSTDGGTSYDAGTSLGAERDEVDVTGLTPGTEYYFKLTTMNADGVESDGMITSIMLPETGAGAGLLVGASLGLAALQRRRRKNKK
ncbi:fibronectin type III domain-containing protein, partial [Patescibacteria group bacterium]